MEFRLNKIDTDIRRKMQEEVRTEKVHNSKLINTNRDLIEDEEKKNKNNNHKNNKKSDRDGIIVDAIKYDNEELIKVDAQKINEITIKGTIIDIKK
ncbi:MAG: hypothetical protein PUE01_04205 [Clostridiaceae bacterium]|nr:hypothetical protein [Clostridiaceae bacterium]